MSDSNPYANSPRRGGSVTLPAGATDADIDLALRLPPAAPASPDAGAPAAPPEA